MTAINLYILRKKKTDDMFGIFSQLGKNKAFSVPLLRSRCWGMGAILPVVNAVSHSFGQRVLLHVPYCQSGGLAIQMTLDGSDGSVKADSITRARGSKAMSVGSSPRHNKGANMAPQQ